MTTNTPEHDLTHEVYIDPKDHKEHINHGMIEYSEEDLKMHNDAFHDHTDNESNPGDGKMTYSAWAAEPLVSSTGTVATAR